MKTLKSEFICCISGKAQEKLCRQENVPFGWFTHQCSSGDIFYRRVSSSKWRKPEEILESYEKILTGVINNE